MAMEEDADLGLAELFQGLLAEPGEALDVTQVEAACVGAEVAEFHVGLVLREQVTTASFLVASFKGSGETVELVRRESLAGLGGNGRAAKSHRGAV